MAEIQLRPWQAEATRKALEWLVDQRADQPFLINAAPGAGKTICASVIAKRLFESNEIDRVIVIAPRTEVVRQWADEFKFVTGRNMMRVTGADGNVEDYGLDLAATWSAVQSLKDAFQQVCNGARTLVICDEHHHAAVEAAWGRDADGAFSSAAHVLILTGTPIRSDGRDTVWLAFDDNGQIEHPDEGMYTLSYGDAVDLLYCRPITFHRHEGRFSVILDGGEDISVSGSHEAELDGALKRVRGLQQALNYYRLACTPKYLADGQTPDRNSYQGTMLEWGVAKLDEIRETMPTAGGLVIAPSIGVAEYMADLLEVIDGERPAIVHNQTPNVENRISAFRNTDKRWIVSVAMISEGVDIKRLRLLVYLPKAQTELSFRQAMGRVVRSFGDHDHSRAYVVMPTHRIFEEYARRVEREMSASQRTEPTSNTKVCSICEAENPRDAADCSSCGNPFPERQQRFKTCPDCEGLNPIQADTCQHCGQSFRMEFDITLDEALRMGAIVRGMDLDEGEVQEGEQYGDEIRERALDSGDDLIVNMLNRLPKESYGRLARIMRPDWNLSEDD